MQSKRWSKPAQVDFFETLAQLISVGYDLEKALVSLQSLLPKLRPDLQVIVAGLREGQHFYQLVTPYVRSEIRRELAFAVVHGNLMEILAEIGSRERRRMRQIQKLRQLLMYPIVLFGLLAVIFAVFVQFLLPEFTNMGMALPTFVGLPVVLSIVAVTLIGHCCDWDSLVATAFLVAKIGGSQTLTVSWAGHPIKFGLSNFTTVGITVNERRQFFCHRQTLCRFRRRWGTKRS